MAQRRVPLGPLATLAAALAGLSALLVAAAPTAAADPAWPEVIALPDGYRPEGISGADGTKVFVGSIPTGAVSLVDVRTGEIDELVPARRGERAAIGLEEHGGLLFVSGGPTGNGYVYDAGTGDDVATLDLASTTDTFINDVVVTQSAAWFTDSRSLELSRVDLATLEVTKLPLTGITLTAGNNLNGIEASPDGRTLYAIQSSTGTLFSIDTTSGAATPVVTGLANGDGLLRDGVTLYVVQNRLNRVAVVDLRSFEVVDTIASPNFQVPTTITRVGSSLYLPNAKFGIASPDAAAYEVVAVPRRSSGT